MMRFSTEHLRKVFSDEEKYKKAIDSLDAYYEARKARAEKEGE